MYVTENAVPKVHKDTKLSETKYNHFLFNLSANMPAIKLDKSRGIITAVPEIVEKLTVSPITVPIQ